MRNPFVGLTRWDSRRRVFVPGLTRMGLVAVLLSAVLAFAAVTQIDLTTQVKGTLPLGNGGTGVTSFAAGLLRSSGSALSSAELSGDATTSASNAVTVGKVNGTSVPTNAAANQVIVTTGSAVGTWSTVPNCTGAIQYNNTTQVFTCGAVLTGTFADAETPTGTINGVNSTFTVAHTVSPALSLQLYKNGQQMIAGGADYTLATATITFTAGAIPKTGDALVAFYRW